MLAVSLSSDLAAAEVRALGLEEKLRVGCYNSPENVTITGDADAVTILAANLQIRGIFARILKTGGKAYHSHHMTEIGLNLEETLLSTISQTSGSSKVKHQVEFVSTVTGYHKEDGFDASYWRRNMESPVLFTQSVEYLLRQRRFHFVEVGPHSALKLPLQQVCAKLGLSENQIPYSTVLTRAKNGVDCILDLIGRLFLYGGSISFQSVNGLEQSPLPKVIHDLPTYPWTYKKLLWNEPRESYELRTRTHPHHELLGTLIPGGDHQNFRWRNLLRLEDVPWLRGHKLEKTIVFPAAAYIAVACEAMRQVLDFSSFEAQSNIDIRKITIDSALILSPEPLEIFTTLRPRSTFSTPNASSWWEFEIISHQGNTSIKHCIGFISSRPYNDQLQIEQTFSASMPRSLSPRACYRRLSQLGLNFGADFQSLQEIYAEEAAIHHLIKSTISLQRLPDIGRSSYLLHPIAIDALLQTGIIADAAGILSQLRGMVPVFIESAQLCVPTSLGTSNVRFINAHAHRSEPSAIGIDAKLEDEDGQLHAQITGLRMRPIPMPIQESRDKRQPMNRLVWKPTLLLNSWSGQDITNHLSIILEQVSLRFRSPYERTDYILSLLSFASPQLRILDLSGGDFLHRRCWQPESRYDMLRNCYIGQFQDDGQINVKGNTFDSADRNSWIPLKLEDEQFYDVIILPKVGLQSLPSNLSAQLILETLSNLWIGDMAQSMHVEEHLTMETSFDSRKEPFLKAKFRPSYHPLTLIDDGLVLLQKLSITSLKSREQPQLTIIVFLPSSFLGVTY